MTKKILPETENILYQIEQLLKRESLAECCQVLWRKWNTALLTEYFADHHLLPVESRITAISVAQYQAAKGEIMTVLQRLAAKNEQRGEIYYEVVNRLKQTLNSLSLGGLKKHVDDLNNEEPQWKIPRRVNGIYDSENEEDWIETQEPLLVDPSEVPYLRIMFYPIILALESLILLTEIQATIGKSELGSILERDNDAPTDIHYLPMLMRDSKILDRINSYLYENGFLDKNSGDARCPFTWIGKDENEEQELYSAVNDSSSDNFRDKKKRKYSSRYHIAALAKWMHDNNLFKHAMYKPSVIAQYFANYYNLTWPHESIRKAFESKSMYEPYFDYFRDLKSQLKL